MQGAASGSPDLLPIWDKAKQQPSTTLTIRDVNAIKESKEKSMFTTIFSAIPKGVTIRRLADDRNAKLQSKAYRFSGKVNNTKKLVYGDSLPEVVKKLKLEIRTQVQ